VVRHVRGVGRHGARALFAAGAITVDGRPARAGAPASAGMRVEVALADERPLAEPELSLDVRLERAALLVVHKPASQPTAPLRVEERGTLVNALLARYPELAGVGHRAREPGLVHRLDTETSGLLVVARTTTAFATLTRALHAGRLTKRYLAITATSGLADQGSVDEPLGPDPTRRGRVRVVPDPTRDYARAAQTRYRVLERTERFTLLELEVARAFRHQIRAHLAAIGAPLVGDALYGGAEWPGAGARHALHASYVAWAGDRTEASFAVNAELPDDMRRLLGG
ncbi:MAG TPA: RluA family pseudouridine synthase, partial [Polyangiaceae bacterium]|nr:RluA family pseudouridine synthase [Polyangiaceae bacterium]